MQSYNIPDLLTKVLGDYWHVNSIDDNAASDIKRMLNSPKFPDRDATFCQQLSSAIREQFISPEEYERLTGEDLESREEVAGRLRELWRDIYDDRPLEP